MQEEGAGAGEGARTWREGSAQEAIAPRGSGREKGAGAQRTDGGGAPHGEATESLGRAGAAGREALDVAAVALRAGREVLGGVLEDLAALAPARRSDALRCAAGLLRGLQLALVLAAETGGSRHGGGSAGAAGFCKVVEGAGTGDGVPLLEEALCAAVDAQALDYLTPPPLPPVLTGHVSSILPY